MDNEGRLIHYPFFKMAIRRNFYASQPRSLAASQPRSILTSLQLDNPAKKRDFSFLKSFKFASVLLTTAVLSACGGGGDGQNTADMFGVSRTEVIEAGEQFSLTFIPGKYTLEVTASDDGVKFQFLGAKEPECFNLSEEWKIHSKTCTLTIQGQLVITNTTGREIVTIKARRH